MKLNTRTTLTSFSGALFLRWNLCFTLTVTASVSWEIPQNLTIFFASFPVKFTCEGVFLLKLQAVLYQLQFYQRWTSCTRFFLNFWQKLSTNQFSVGYFHLLLSIKLFSEKKSVLLKLPHLTLAGPFWSCVGLGHCAPPPF